MLKMVTWDGDLTQFLVYAETDDEAIQLAIKSNREIDKYYRVDPNSDEYREHIESLENKSTYNVEDMDSIRCIDNILNRNDCDGMYANAIVFGA